MVRDELCVFMERNHSIGVHGAPPPRSSPPGLCNVNNLAGKLFPEKSAHIPPTLVQIFHNGRKIDPGTGVVLDETVSQHKLLYISHGNLYLFLYFLPGSEIEIFGHDHVIKTYLEHISQT